MRRKFKNLEIFIHHYNFKKLLKFRPFSVQKFKYQIFIHDFYYFDSSEIRSKFKLNRYSTYFNFINNASKILVPSQFVKDSLTQLSISADIQNIEIFEPAFMEQKIISPAYKEGNNLAFFGSFLESKGSKIILELAEHLSILRNDVKLYVHGHGDSEVLNSENLKFCGRYTSESISEIISTQGIKILILPFQDPETFSFVFHELYAPNLVFFVSNIGIFTNDLDMSPYLNNLHKIDNYWDVDAWVSALNEYFTNNSDNSSN